MNNVARAQITVRQEFSEILKSRFPRMRSIGLFERSLFGLGDPDAQFGEIPVVQAFLQRLRIPYDLSWEEGDCFDPGVRQIRYREGTQEEVENWIFPWEGLTSDQVAVDRLAAANPSPIDPVVLLQWLGEESASAHSLQALNSIPLSLQHRLLVGIYTQYAKLLRYRWQALRDRVVGQFSALARCAAGVRLRVSDLLRFR